MRAILERIGVPDAKDAPQSPPVDADKARAELVALSGELAKVQGETTAFQLVGILASSSYLALRGGYSYQSSLRDIVDPSRRRRQPSPG